MTCLRAHWVWMMLPMFIFMSALTVLMLVKQEFLMYVACQQATGAVCTSSQLSNYTVPASTYSLYTSVAELTPAVFTGGFYGALSDTVGRRPLLLVASFGYFVNAGGYLIVYVWNLPLYTIYIGSLVSGLCGSVASVYMAMFSYLADVSAPEIRAFTYGWLDVSLYAGSLVGSLIAGPMVDQLGYVWPFSLIVGMFGFMFCYFLATPESLHVTKRALFSLRKANVLASLAYFTKPCRDGRLAMVLVATSFVMYICSIMGVVTVLLYWTQADFGWTATDYSWFSAILTALRIFFLLFVYGFVHRVCKKWISEVSLMIVGNTVGVVGLALVTWASGSLFLLIATVPLAFQVIAGPSYRAYFSKSVSQLHQGGIMSAVGVIEALSFMLGPLIFNPLWSATAVSLPNCSMIVSLAFNVLCFLSVAVVPFAISIHHRRERRMESEGVYSHTTVIPVETTAPVAYIGSSPERIALLKAAIDDDEETTRREPAGEFSPPSYGAVIRGGNVQE